MKQEADVMTSSPSASSSVSTTSLTPLSNTLSSANSLAYPSASPHAHSLDQQSPLPVYTPDPTIGYNAYASYSAMTEPYFSATSKAAARAATTSRYTRGWDYTGANYHPYVRVGGIYPGARSSYGATPGYEAF